MTIKITDKENEKIWNVWSKWNRTDNMEFSMVWKGYNTFFDELNAEIEMNKIKKFMKIMRLKKIGYCSPTMRDYEICGSGNFIYEKYLDLSWEDVKESISK